MKYNHKYAHFNVFGVPAKGYWINYLKDTNITHVHSFILIHRTHTLICRKDHLSQWGLPGGTLKVTESYTEALTRELKEEIQVIPKKSIIPLKVFFITTKAGHIQNRLLCLVEEADFLPREKDLDTQTIWEIKVVPLNFEILRQFLEIYHLSDIIDRIHNILGQTV